MKVKLDGKLNISVADQKAEVELSQNQDTTTTTTDAPAATPAAPAAPAGTEKKQ